MRKIIFPIYLLFSCIFLIALLEIGSFFILKSAEDQSNLFFQKQDSPQNRDPEGNLTYSTLDPHLGYTHGINETRVKSLNPNYRWLDGFLIYDKRVDNFERPIILALGGSTTDGIRVGHSWPEELSKLMKLSKIKGTVINGGIGGYSTNQELIKLIRDGVEVNPDIVISYSGINDRGQYSELPYPMVHSYQRTLFGSLTGQRPIILPNTIKFIRKFLLTTGEFDVLTTYGLASKRNLSEQYEKNIELMNSVCIWAKCKFFNFIQPFAFYNSRHGKGRAVKSVQYVDNVLKLYDRIILLPKTHDYIIDATQILENSNDVFGKDGVHLNENGDRVVGEYIFTFLRNRNDL